MVSTVRSAQPASQVGQPAKSTSMNLLFIIFSLFASNFIDWSETRKLTWEDFQGPVETTTGKAALTHSSIHAQFGYNQDGLQFTIKCQFDKNKSWGRIKNDYILAHEQKHFDLTEVFARKLNKELKEYKFNNATVGDDINRIYQGMVNELTYTQQQYDKETDHSRNPPVQLEWNNRIDSLLKVTAPYKNYNRGPLK